MKFIRTLAIGCAALMGLTLLTPPEAEARRHRRVVRFDDDGVRVSHTMRSRPRYSRAARWAYPRYSGYRGYYPRHSSYYQYPRPVRYSRRPVYSSGFYSSPRYYWSSYPRYYTRPINYYYSDPYYCPPGGGVTLSFGGGRYWGW